MARAVVVRTQPQIMTSLETRKEWQEERGLLFKLHPPAILDPSAITRAYRQKIVSWFQVLFDLTNERLIAALPVLLERLQTEAGHRQDDANDELQAILNGISVEFGRRLTEDEIRRVTRFVGSQVSGFNLNQNDKVLRTVLGVDVFRSEPWVQSQINSFVTQNAKLIKSLEGQYLKDIELIVMQGVRQGITAKEVSKTIRNRFGVTKSRSELIARDQIGKLNGQMTGIRQQDIGVKSYIWRTSLDERVRPSHVSLENKVFSWTKPPPEGHPGEPINCRCYAEPVLEDLI